VAYIEIEYDPAVCVTVGHTADPQLSSELVLESGSKPSVAEQSLNDGETTAVEASHWPTIVSPGPKISPSEGLFHVTVGVVLQCVLRMKNKNTRA
jgi:hypothetical protein